MYEEHEATQGADEMAAPTLDAATETSSAAEREGDTPSEADAATPNGEVDSTPIRPGDEGDAFADGNPTCGKADSGDVRQELTLLREELNVLRAELRERRETTARLEAERAEFYELYPNTPLSELPDEVWEGVDRGVPLAASYALALRKRELLRQKAEQANRSNRRRATGALEQDGDLFFSPSEVRAMTPDEVKRHFSCILHSMQSWH